MRDLNDGDGVATMTLEHYPGMTEKALEEIVAEARARWDIIDVTVIHRVGELQPTDQIVLVVVASAHRGDAFAACEFIMDYLKTRGAVLEEGGDAGGRALGRGARDRRRRARALGRGRREPMTRDGPLLTVLAAVGVGAVLGAWLRWALGVLAQPRVVHLPLGTLAANLHRRLPDRRRGRSLCAHPSISPDWRLVLITGFLGGLTTFSTFSAESVVLLQGEHWQAAATHVLAHLGGSLLATFAGIATYRVVSLVPGLR